MAHSFFQNIRRTAVYGSLTTLIVLALLPLMSCSNSDSSSSALITVQELKEKADQGEKFILIDVRTEGEYDAGHLAFTDLLIDYRDLPQYLDSLPEDKTVPIYSFCRSGNRSGTATRFLREAGYKNALNVKGGIIAWVNAGFEVVATE